MMGSRHDNPRHNGIRYTTYSLPATHPLRNYGRDSRFESLFDRYKRDQELDSYFAYGSGTQPARPMFDGYRHEYPPSRDFDRRTRNRGRILGPEHMDHAFDGDNDHDEPREKMTFGMAIKKLNIQLQTAEGIYRNVLDDYNREVSTIKSYTPDEILVQLWRLKISGKRIKRKNGENEDYDDSTPDDSNSNNVPVETFQQQMSKVRKVFEQTQSSSIETNPNQNAIKHEALERLKEKIDVAGTQICELLPTALGASEDCEALIKELEYLKDLLENNKGLYGAEDRNSDASY